MIGSDLTIIGLFAAILIFVLVVCIYMCIRSRSFLGGPGSVVSFMLAINISYYLSRHCEPPYKNILIALVGLCYLWFYVVRPFRAGLRGDK